MAVNEQHIASIIEHRKRMHAVQDESLKMMVDTHNKHLAMIDRIICRSAGGQPTGVAEKDTKVGDNEVKPTT